MKILLSCVNKRVFETIIFCFSRVKHNITLSYNALFHRGMLPWHLHWWNALVPSHSRASFTLVVTNHDCCFLNSLVTWETSGSPNSMCTRSPQMRSIMSKYEQEGDIESYKSKTEWYLSNTSILQQDNPNMLSYLHYWNLHAVYSYLKFNYHYWYVNLYILLLSYIHQQC